MICGAHLKTSNSSQFKKVLLKVKICRNKPSRFGSILLFKTNSTKPSNRVSSLMCVLKSLGCLVLPQMKIFYPKTLNGLKLYCSWVRILNSSIIRQRLCSLRT